MEKVVEQLAVQEKARKDSIKKLEDELERLSLSDEEIDKLFEKVKERREVEPAE